MKKILLVMLLVMCLASPVFANQGSVQRIFNEVPIIGSTGTNGNTESSIIKVESSDKFSAWVDVNTPGALHTPSVNISYQVSYDKTATNFATPTTVDGTVIGTVVLARTSTNPTVIELTPTTAKYMRFIANGTGANTTGTTVTMYLFSQGS